MQTFLENNRTHLYNQLEVGDIAVFYAGQAPVSTSDSFYPFRPDKNFYYLTGLKSEGFILVMAKQEKELTTTLFIKKPDYDMEKWVGRYLSDQQCKDISGIQTILYLEAFDEWFNKMVNSTYYKRVYLDLFKPQYQVSDSHGLKMAHLIRERYPYLVVANSHGIMSQLRIIKSDFEINKIKEATELTRLGLEAILNTLQPGDYEYMPAAEFNYVITKNGGDRNAFETIAASGENAVILHYIENEGKMKKGDLILFDLGAQFKEYAADISRTYPISGQFTQRQKVIYNIVLKAQKSVINQMKPGMTIKACNEVCKAFLIKELQGIGLIEEPEELGQYYYHGVSHFLGLDVHDVGFRDIPFEPGMVLTVEPGLYIAEEKIGIRIEDNVVITKEGTENLSVGLIKEVDEIEAFMAK